MRRMTAKIRIFQLKIQLREVRPPVWRRVLVPSETTLAELHEVLQVAMGWTDSHLHEFEVDGARYGMPDPNWDPDADWDLDEVADESRVTLCQVAGDASQASATRFSQTFSYETCEPSEHRSRSGPTAWQGEPVHGPAGTSMRGHVKRGGNEHAEEPIAPTDGSLSSSCKMASQGIVLLQGRGLTTAVGELTYTGCHLL